MARTTIREEDITSGAVPTTGIVGTSVFTSSGTWTKATREAALGVTIKRVIVEVQGAGGGGDNATGTPRSGAGGGYVRKLIDVSSISSATITVGSGGGYVGGVTTTKNSGGDSVWNDGTNTLTGGGGQANGTGTATGGTATGGDLNISGQNGPITYGTGGNSYLGLGGTTYIGNTLSNPTGVTSTGYGAGGGAGGGTNGAYGGGPGGDGIVIVTEIAG